LADIEKAAGRERLLVIALWLSAISVGWGIASGGLSVTVGIRDGSLGVVGLGLNVLADVIGSIVLVWRFRAELRHSAFGAHTEERAAHVIAAALAAVSLVLTVSAVQALAVGSHPGHSMLGIIAATLAVLVLTPLAYGKRRVARELGSRALRGDGALSGIGAVVGVLALGGLLLDDAFDLWWADRVAAMIVAGIAAVEAVRAARVG
jgi:divalent metal cation (Fe/Co/Zn/Cd) transporter